MIDLSYAENCVLRVPVHYANSVSPADDVRAALARLVSPLLMDNGVISSRTLTVMLVGSGQL
jgi:hypothetical protein